MGECKFPTNPAEPIGLQLVHVPVEPNRGLDARAQGRLGRLKLLQTKFSDFERRIRDDLSRMLAGSGFDVERDILGITVNRWSHGYSYTPNSLYDDIEVLEAKAPMMRRGIGRIAFANSDTGWDDCAHVAIREADRAVEELATT